MAFRLAPLPFPTMLLDASSCNLVALLTFLWAGALVLPTCIAQSPPQCAVSCGNQAASQLGCSGIQDTNCVCTTIDFVSRIAECIGEQCAEGNIAAATIFVESICPAEFAPPASSSAAPPPSSGAPNPTSASGGSSTALPRPSPSSMISSPSSATRSPSSSPSPSVTASPIPVSSPGSIVSPSLLPPSTVLPTASGFSPITSSVTASSLPGVTPSSSVSTQTASLSTPSSALPTASQPPSSPSLSPAPSPSGGVVSNAAQGLKSPASVLWPLTVMLVMQRYVL